MIHIAADNHVDVNARINFVLKTDNAPRENVIDIFSQKPVLDLQSHHWRCSDRFEAAVDGFPLDEEILDIVKDDMRREERRETQEISGGYICAWEERYTNSTLRAIMNAEALVDSGFTFVDKQRIHEDMKDLPAATFIKCRKMDFSDGFDLGQLQEELPLRNLGFFLEMFTRPNEQDGSHRDIRELIVTTTPLLQT